MKKPSILSVVLLATCACLSQAAVAAEPDDLHDGYWWSCVGQDQKKWGTAGCTMFQLAYVMGYAEGLLQGINNANLQKTLLQGSIKRSNSADDKARMEITVSVADQLIERNLEGITYGQLIEGVNKFYSDFRNKQLETTLAFDIVGMQVRGEEKTYVDCMEDYYRFLSSQKNTEKILDEATKPGEATKRLEKCKQIRNEK